MPQAIGIFLAYVGGAIVTGLTAVGFSLGSAMFILSTGVQLAGLSLLGALARKLFPIPDLHQTATANILTVRGTLEHQRLIYGEVMVSGPLQYMNAAGTHNQSLYHSVVVAGHEIEDMTDMRFDDQDILEADIDWAGVGDVTANWPRGNGSFPTTTYFQKKLGLDNQSASNFLAAGDGLGGAFTEIGSQHQGRNIAYFVARIDYFEGQTDVWSGGAPKNFRALVKGKKVYNPNSDSTQSWGTGPHRLATPATWEWSHNPALCWADYMIDAKLGFGEDSARVNYAYVASVAAICSGSVSTPNSDTTERFTCNGTLNTSTTHKGNLASILSAGNMTMALVQGVWKLRGWEFETPTLSFDDNDLRGDMQIKLSTEERQRYNTVRGSFVDRNREWTAQQFPSFAAAEYIARDNGEVLFKNIQLPMTTDVYMAQRLAAGVLEQSDLQTVVIYPSNFKTLPVEIGGTIMLSNEKMDWVDKDFRVTNYKLNDMAGIDLVLQEDNSASYTQVATDEYTVSSGGGYVTADPGVPAPTNFDISNGPEGIHLVWTPPPARLYEYVNIHRNFVNSFDNAVLEYKSTDDNYIDTPKTQGRYYYWLQAESFIGELSSRVPAGDGVEGVFVAETTLTSDPGFEQTRLGQNDNTFWSDINSFTFGVGPEGSGGFVVTSDAGAPTDTPFLSYFATVQSDTAVPYFIRNNKWSPIVPGVKINLWFSYRVPIFTEVDSAFITAGISGHKSVRAISGVLSPTGIASRQVAITNSIGWSVFSEQLQYSDLLLNTNSHTQMAFSLSIRHTATGVGTGSMGVDIDKAFITYVN